VQQTVLYDDVLESDWLFGIQTSRWAKWPSSEMGGSFGLWRGKESFCYQVPPIAPADFRQERSKDVLLSKLRGLQQANANALNSLVGIDVLEVHCASQIPLSRKPSWNMTFVLNTCS
jgi:hypothetical protein